MPKRLDHYWIIACCATRNTLPAFLLSVTEAADALGVSRKTLSGILNGRVGIRPDMAIRLSMAFGTSPESWLNQQSMHDL